MFTCSYVTETEFLFIIEAEHNFRGSRLQRSGLLTTKYARTILRFLQLTLKYVRGFFVMHTHCPQSLEPSPPISV